MSTKSDEDCLWEKSKELGKKGRGNALQWSAQRLRVESAAECARKS